MTPGIHQELSPQWKMGKYLIVSSFLNISFRISFGEARAKKSYRFFLMLHITDNT